MIHDIFSDTEQDLLWDIKEEENEEDGSDVKILSDMDSVNAELKNMDRFKFLKLCVARVHIAKDVCDLFCRNLRRARTLRYISFAFSGFGTAVLWDICDVLKQSQCLVHVDFSHTKMIDRQCEAILEMLYRSRSITVRNKVLLRGLYQKRHVAYN